MLEAPLGSICQAFLRTFTAVAGASTAKPSTCRAYSRTRYEPGVQTGMKTTSAVGSAPGEVTVAREGAARVIVVSTCATCVWGSGIDTR